MKFEYKKIEMFDDFIDIPNIAQCALELITEHALNYYLIIRTVLGTSIIFEYGPIVPDISVLPKSFSCKITTVEYSENKLKTAVSKFIADRKLDATEFVRVLPIKEVLDICINPVEYMRQYDAEEEN